MHGSYLVYTACIDCGWSDRPDMEAIWNPPIDGWVTPAAAAHG